jgi:hypothetical protein
MSTISAQPPAARGDYATVPIAGLRMGSILRHPIYDAREGNEVLLLASAAGTARLSRW